MSADAIAVFHPQDPEQLKPFLDLDDSEESDGLYAEAFEDGTFLVHTFQPFQVFEENPAEAHAWLAQFGPALDVIHDDPRGLLFFPDSCEPAATTYEAIIEELADKGIFITPDAPTLDLEALQSLANQLLGGMQGAPGTPATGAGSFEIAKLLEGMNEQLANALGVQPATPPAPATRIRDEEFTSRQQEEVVSVHESRRGRPFTRERA